jgi:ubiquinone/menaquinone biosynthesis C-methylase UbiE
MSKMSRGDVRDWWASFPMTYGSVHGATQYTGEEGTERIELGSDEFFTAVDREFYRWNDRLHTPPRKFSRIFPYERYVGAPVLEVGCGMGTMAMNWAQNGARVTATDLNPVAVHQTQRRFALRGVTGTLVQADARALPFRADTFDYFYSWGVLHHSPDLEGSLAECFRVLRPHGGFGLMLYNRASIYYRYRVQFVEGFLHGESRFLGPLELASRYGDGAREEGNPHTWPVTAAEVRDILRKYSRNVKVCTFGMDLDSSLAQLIPLPKIRRYLPVWLKKPWARRWGWSLWITGDKI